MQCCSPGSERSLIVGVGQVVPFSSDFLMYLAFCYCVIDERWLHPFRHVM